MSEYVGKYGEWAVVAGGSEGMGGEFSSYLARQGMNVVVTGRNAKKVEEKCRQLEEDFKIQTLALPVDFGDLGAPQKVEKATAGLEVGFLVYNAGLASLQRFQNLDIECEMYRLNVNVRSLLALTLLYAKHMVARRKGGIILLSSSGGIVGTPYIQTYSATKAYSFTLAEALWAELKEYNLDVMAVLPGNTIGQNFTDVPPGTPGFQTGREVVEEVFRHFGRQPTLLAGKESKQQLGKYFDMELRKEGILQMKQAFTEMMEQYGTNT